MNETIKMIRAIESQMNKHWSTVLDTLKGLNENVSANLDSLLTGINPKGLKETSNSLKEIMDTMNKSVQSMNLEKVLSELKILQSGTYMVPTAVQASTQPQPEQIVAGSGLKPPNLNPPSGAKAKASSSKEAAAEWVDPHEKKKDEEEEPHLLRPSDFFGS
ncbi:MAG: hypothetical protein ACFFAN_05145 [Promethearchaeota archaeon]